LTPIRGCGARRFSTGGWRRTESTPANWWAAPRPPPPLLGPGPVLAAPDAQQHRLQPQPSGPLESAMSSPFRAGSRNPVPSTVSRRRPRLPVAHHAQIQAPFPCLPDHVQTLADQALPTRHGLSGHAGLAVSRRGRLAAAVRPAAARLPLPSRPFRPPRGRGGQAQSRSRGTARSRWRRRFAPACRGSRCTVRARTPASNATGEDARLQCHGRGRPPPMPRARTPASSRASASALRTPHAVARCRCPSTGTGAVARRHPCRQHCGIPGDGSMAQDIAPLPVGWECRRIRKAAIRSWRPRVAPDSLGDSGEAPGLRRWRQRPAAPTCPALSAVHVPGLLGACRPVGAVLQCLA
jgi:hypothetical protein